MASDNRARVTVAPEGKAMLYQHQAVPGYAALGVVTQGDATGALLRNDETGQYVMANAGAIRSLDQRKVLSALSGQNATKMIGGKRRNVYMSDADAEYLRELGGGNLSEGIRVAVSLSKQ